MTLTDNEYKWHFLRRACQTTMLHRSRRQALAVCVAPFAPLAGNDREFSKAFILIAPAICPAPLKQVEPRFITVVTPPARSP